MGMSEELKEMMRADVETTVDDWSATLTYKGAAVVGTFSPVSSGDAIDEMGILQTADATFCANADLFATVPGVRDVVDVDGTKYYVQNRTNDPAAVTLELKRG